jgi:hypothetical protein
MLLLYSCYNSIEYYCYSFQIYSISVKLCDNLGTVGLHGNLTTNYNIVPGDNPVPSMC